MNPINKSIGGTFVYDEAGVFVRHIPPTQVTPDSSVDDPPEQITPEPLPPFSTHRGKRRHITQE